MNFSIILVTISAMLTIDIVKCDRFKQAINRTFVGFEKENNLEWKEDFTFIQGTDPQYGLIEYFANNETNTGYWAEERALMRAAVQQWNTLTNKPKFIVITGDLANDFFTPDEQSIIAKRRRQQLNDLRADLNALNNTIPLVLLSGNHDILNSPTVESINAYTNEFGNDYFFFAVNGVAFIVLNSQLYKNHSLVPEQYERQEQWLDRVIDVVQQNNYTHVIVFQHVPWFFHTIDEPVDLMFTIDVDERKRMIQKLYERAKVRYIFAGHYHRNAFGMYKQLHMITTSAIGWQGETKTKSGFQVVRVTRDAVNYEYVNINKLTNNYSECTRIHWFVILILMITFVTIFN